MYAEDPFRRTQTEFYRLRRQLADGQITQQQFDAALKGLMVQHSGRWWMIGTQNGKWYVYDGQNWIESQPPAGQPQPMREPKPIIHGGPSVPAGPLPETAPVLAGFWRQMGAFLMDLTLLCGGAIVALDSLGTNLTSVAICLALLVAYYVGWWAQGGRTIGEMRADVKVVRTDGSPISLGRALLRFIGYLISVFCLGLGFLWAVWDSKKQTWHDKMADTHVVRAFSRTED